MGSFSWTIEQRHSLRELLKNVSCKNLLIVVTPTLLDESAYKLFRILFQDLIYLVEDFGQFPGILPGSVFGLVTPGASGAVRFTVLPQDTR